MTSMPAVRGSGADIRGFEPNTGSELEPAYRYGDATHVEAACAAAATAFGEYRAASRAQRASFLEAIADNMVPIADELVARVAAESGLPEGP
jgi:alpha-ketoglutaric semialdehyde dehydrogenase